MCHMLKYRVSFIRLSSICDLKYQRQVFSSYSAYFFITLYRDGVSYVDYWQPDFSQWLDAH